MRVYRLRHLADEYCNQWEESVAQGEIPPMPSGLFEKLPGKSSLRQYFPAVFNYLNDCRWSPCLPHSNRILALLVPRVVKRGQVPRPYGFATGGNPGTEPAQT